MISNERVLDWWIFKFLRKIDRVPRETLYIFCVIKLYVISNVLCPKSEYDNQSDAENDLLIAQCIISITVFLKSSPY